MNKNDTLYGLKDWERLELGIGDVIERVIDDACEKAGESFDEIADRIGWPLRIIEFKRKDINEKDVARKAEHALDHMIESLDEDYGQEDDYTVETEGMKAAALVFARAVAAEYVPWQWEPNGVVHEFNCKQIRAESEG